MSYARLSAAASAVGEHTGRERHDIGVVLGSGLGDYADTFTGAVSVPYAEIPHFPIPAVEGHAGRFVSGLVDGRPLLVAAGRVHAYEGWDLGDVVFGVRTMALTGCRTVVLTNAAGGIGDGLSPGDLVTIRDHINLAARNPLVGPNDERLGPRFPDLSDVYRSSLRKVIAEVAHSLDMPYHEGVYAWMLGPSYETPAEIHMARQLGAALVGMSTVPEAIALTHMGVGVAAISLVTNLAAGMATAPLSHEEVTEVAQTAKSRFAALLDALLPRLAGEAG